MMTTTNLPTNEELLRGSADAATTPMDNANEDLERVLTDILGDIPVNVKELLADLPDNDVANTPKLHPFTLYISTDRGNARNTSYPFKVSVTSANDLIEAASYDHVGCQFADGKNNRGRLVKGYRKNSNFQSSDVIIMDCDNTTANPLSKDLTPDQWIEPEDVRAAFPDVPFCVVYSRNHMKEKNGKAARPKFHVYFPLGKPVQNSAALEKLKKSLMTAFPAFDDRSLDTAHFMFGVENPSTLFFSGNICIDEYLPNRTEAALPETIPCGSRNATLSAFASRIIKRLGDTDKACEEFYKVANRCEEPLDNDELNTIWRGAQKFFHSVIEKSPNYQSANTYDINNDFEALDDKEEADPTDGKKRAIITDDIRIILKNQGIRVRFNEITGEGEAEGLPPRYSKSNALNVLPVLIRDYLVRHGRGCSISIIGDCLTVILDENRYNPVVDMLKDTEWDGIDRLPELFEVLGVQDENERLYITKFLHQCIALAHNSEDEPYGADGVLVFQGDQGVGKTRFFTKLAVMPEWFRGGVSIDLNNKDSIIESTSKWIAEMGELDSTLKREQSALKAFLTAETDVYRLPYGRVAIRRPRRTSFCATVNPKEFLNDETGSRRFWVVHPSIDLDHLNLLQRDWFRQLWKQVYETMFKKNPQGFRLTREEQKVLQERNQTYSKPLIGEIELVDRLNFNAPIDQWRWMKATEVLNGLSLYGVSAVQLGRVLTKLAAQEHRIKIKSPRNVKWYFLPPPCEDYVDSASELYRQCRAV